MTVKRKRHSAEFKAKVALDAIRGEQTSAKLAAKHGVDQTIINTWKTQAIEGMSRVFSGKAEAAEAAREGEIGQFHAKSRTTCRGTRTEGPRSNLLRRASGR